MKKTWKIIGVIILTMFLGGCFNLGTPTAIEIAPPKNNVLPFKGTWEIVKYINSGFASSKKSESENWIGKKAMFSTDGVKVGDNIWAKPGYKVKRVNPEDYFLYRYGVSRIDFTVNEKEVFVTSITSGDKFLYDFVRLSDNEALLTIQSSICMLKKISSDVDDKFVEELSKRKDQDNEVVYQADPKRKDSGLLLGLRYLKNPNQRDDSNTPAEYGYKTLWIAFENSVFHPILETNDIFLPRKNGFWKVESERVKSGSYIEDKLMVYNPYQLDNKGINDAGSGKGNVAVLYDKDKPVAANANGLGIIDNKDLNPNQKDPKQSALKSICRKILFIGNDYVSMELAYPGQSNQWQNDQDLSIMRVQPVDNISGEHGLKISDLTGDKGLKILKDSRNNLISGLNLAGFTEIDKEIEDENFYLQRKNGHWFLKGRLNYSHNDSVAYSDFSINMIIPSTLVRFDALAIPWTDIKDRVPEAIDAFTSPYEDMAVIVSYSKLYIYQIINGRLADEPFAKVKLSRGESVIMAEWATGKYVDNWEDSFMKNEYSRVDYK
ncbi:MAG: hypothetical protein Q8942_04870 [Bacillota bacterium]|nr:hypothetical protein [Bacillota bacterium]